MKTLSFRLKVRILLSILLGLFIFSKPSRELLLGLGISAVIFCVDALSLTAAATSTLEAGRILLHHSDGLEGLYSWDYRSCVGTMWIVRPLLLLHPATFARDLSECLCVDNGDS